MDKQKKMHEDDLNASDPDMIKIPAFLHEKLKLIDRQITKKGKSGKQIMNLEVNEARKRKRYEAFKDEVSCAFETDKVWLPQEDLDADENPLPHKQYVPLETYNQAKSLYKEINQSAKQYIDGISQVPYNTAKCLKGKENCKLIYETTKDNIINSVGWSEKTEIPDFWEAQRRWGVLGE